MTMTGVYRIALLPTADEQKFVKHMTTVVFETPGALQLTRTTTGFDHRLLKINSELRQYAWQATVHLMTDAPYNFVQYERVQEAIKKFGVLIGLETYTNIEVGQTAKA